MSVFSDRKKSIDYDKLLERFTFLNRLTPNKKFPISCIFLSQFDMKKGNVIVWAKQAENCNIDIKGIEFKSLPSGIHEIENDVINFVIPKDDSITANDSFFYGVACYKQNGQDIARHADQVDRTKVKMYSLGIIIDPSVVEFSNINFTGSVHDDEQDDNNELYYSWKPNQYISCNEYVSSLQSLLKDWFLKEEFNDFTLFENFFNENSVLNQEFTTNSLSKDYVHRKHMLEYLPFWVKKLGPLIFPLWKSCILNESLLIVKPTDSNFELCNALVYCLSLISQIFLENQQQKAKGMIPLFTIGVNDIEYVKTFTAKSIQLTNSSKNSLNFVACTSDEVLTYKPELFDKMLILPANFMNENNELLPKIVLNNGEELKATPHEFDIYDKLISGIFDEQLSRSQKITFNKLTEPISWIQYIIDGFYLWTTAGYFKASYHQKGLPDFSIYSKYSYLDLRDEKFSIVVNLLKYFHLKTITLRNNISSLVESSACSGDSGLIRLGPSDFIRMDLDCFSEQDLKFVHELILKWYHKDMEVNNGEYIRAAC